MRCYKETIKNEASEWLGDKIMVSDDKGVNPKLHLEVCGKGFFKLCYEEKTLFWAKQHASHYAVALLKTFDYESILSSIHSCEVEKRKGLNKAENLASWSAYFIKDLEKKADELLYDGEWLMTAYIHEKKYNSYTPLHKNDLGAKCILGVDNALDETHFQEVPWFIGEDSLVNLKRVNKYDSRLKWWRKKARENALPPIVILYISGLDHYIILDGHYRLEASYLENIQVDVLVLSPVRKREYTWDNEKEKKGILNQIEANDFDVRHTNSLLIKAYTNKEIAYVSTSRVFVKSQHNGIKEVANYLNKLNRMDLIQSFFDGEWENET